MTTYSGGVIHETKEGEKYQAILELSLDGIVAEFLASRERPTQNLSIVISKSKKRNKGHKRIKEDDPLLKQDCPICISGYQPGEFKRTLQCGHTFHKKCVDRWIKHQKQCPICRQISHLKT